MELRHLRYFVAVAEAGSFVKAARALRVAQPAVSRQVQDLERELGVTLLEREPHGVRLSPAGKGFLADARRTLRAADKATARARKRVATGGRVLRLVCSELLSQAATLSDLIHCYRQMNPAVDVDLDLMNVPSARTAIAGGQADVAFMFVGGWPRRGFAGVRLVDCSMTGVLIPSEHPLAAKKTLRTCELVTLPWLHLPRDATWGAYEALYGALRERGGWAAHQAVRPPSFAFLPLIAAGEGWAFSDRAMAAVFTRATKAVAYRPLTEPPIPIWMAALWKSSGATAESLAFTRLVESRSVSGHPSGATSLTDPTAPPPPQSAARMSHPTPKGPARR